MTGIYKIGGECPQCNIGTLVVYNGDLICTVCGPVRLDVASMVDAIALLVERDSEEYDRTLPGWMFHDEWIPLPEHSADSRKFNRQKRKQGALALEILHIKGALPRPSVYGYDAASQSIKAYEQCLWWETVWTAWREAGSEAVAKP